MQGDDQIQKLIDALSKFVNNDRLQKSTNYQDRMQIWNEFCSNFIQIGQILQPKSEEYKFVVSLVKKIKETTKRSRLSQHKTDNVFYIFKEITIYLNSYSMNNAKSKLVSKSLFKLLMQLTNNDTPIPDACPFYLIHDDIVYAKDRFISLEASNESFKTKLAPFFLSIVTINDNMKRPFIIFTEPNNSIVNETNKDFRKNLKSLVTLVKDQDQMFSLYSRYLKLIKEEKTKTRIFHRLFSKPIVCLLTPHKLLSLLSKTKENDIDMIAYTRFCIDECNDRSVDSDVLTAIVSSRINNCDEFPLQVLLMSSTPNDQLYRCFVNAKKLVVQDFKQPPINEIKATVSTKDDIDNEVIKQTYGIIEKFDNSPQEKGNILIYTSNNSRIKSIHKGIIDQCVQYCKNMKNYVVVIRDFESMARNVPLNVFYKKITNIIKKSEKSHKNGNKKLVFLLPIKYHCSSIYDKICNNPIPSHDNIIKLVITTNTLESSLEIDNLAAVIDSCLYDKTFYNKDNGLVNIVEEPISMKNKIIPKRLIRDKSGIYCQITIQNVDLRYEFPPEIQTTDILQNILTLRSMGYELEKINNNLPDPIKLEDINRSISDLEKFGALDPGTHNLTPLGKLLGSFNFLSPFIVSAILKISDYSINNDDENRQTVVIKTLLGFLIALLFNYPNICTNKQSKKLTVNYDPESDVSTILMTFLDLMQNSRNKVNKMSDEYGFYLQNIKAIIDITMQTAEQLPYFVNQKKKKIKDKENDDDLNEEEESNDIIDEAENSLEEIDCNSNNEELTTSNIFFHLHKYAKELKSTNKLNDFITSLIHEIGKNKPEWHKSIIAQFSLIQKISSNPSIIYKGDQSLKFDGENESLINIIMRPGSFGLDFPATCYVLSISHECTVKKNFGFLIHYDKSLPNANSIMHPTSIQCPITLNNIFTELLLEGYLSDQINFFQKLYRGKSTDGNDADAILYRSQGFHIDPKNPEEKQSSTYFSYIPKNEKSHENFQNAIKVVEKLIPFTPSTYLVPNYMYKCFVSIRGFRTDVIDSSVHMFNNDNYFAYQINHDSLNYILQNIDKLKSPMGEMSIAMTGEAFSLFNDNESKFEKEKITDPHISQQCSSVFSSNRKFYSHIVLTTTTKIPMNGNIKQLQWTENDVSCDFSNEDYIIYLTNHISKDLLSVKKFGTCLIFTTSSSIININGTIPNRSETQVKLPLKEIMNLYATNYIKNSTLKEPLNFNSFKYEGNDMGSDIFVKNDSPTSPTRGKKPFNKKQRVSYSLNKSSKLYELSKLEKTHIKYFGDGCICLETYNPNVNDIKTKALNIISQHYSGVSVEEVNYYQFTINHSKYSFLNKEQFISKVVSISKQFGAVLKTKEYFTSNSNLLKGAFDVNFYSYDFLIPFGEMIKQTFESENQNKILKFEDANIDPFIANNRKVTSVLKDWFSKHNLKIKKDSWRWFGTENNVNESIRLLKEDPPEIPFKQFPIPNNVNLLFVQRQIRKRRSEKWILNKKMRILYVPTSSNIENAQKFIDSLQHVQNKDDNPDDINEIEKVIGDINACDEPELSRNQINIFLEDGNVIQRNYCVTCVCDMLEYNIGERFDSSNNEINMDEINKNPEFIKPVDLYSSNSGNNSQITFPLISFGQMYWDFVNEPKIYNWARAWITITSIQTIRFSQYFSFCPDHPYFLIPVPMKDTYVKCLAPECNNKLCGNCGRWHEPGKCDAKVTIPPGCRICPYCHGIVEKTEACNHLACRCGKDFCYYCGLGMSEGKHSISEHGDIYNHPPDYRKYILKENISDQELEEFYKKFPQWRPNVLH